MLIFPRGKLEPDPSLAAGTLNSLAELGTVTRRVTEYQPEVPTLAATVTEAASSTVTHVVTVIVLPGLTHLTGDDSVGE